MTSSSADAMPFAKLMGVEIIEASRDGVTGKLLVRPDLCTTGGIAHGGAIMALADSLGAVAAFLALPAESKGTTTLESKTNFLGGAKSGTTLIGVTSPIHRGRRTSVWQTRIDTEDGKPVALVLQTQMAL